jgi:hypothetical protein
MSSTRVSLLGVVPALFMVGACANHGRRASAALTRDARPRSLFTAPADLDDFGPGRSSAHARFNALWSENINAWTLQAIDGDSWTHRYDPPRPGYLNPLTTTLADTQRHQARWSPFPNRLRVYFAGSLSTEDVYELADNGRLGDGRTVPDVPATVCPRLDPNTPTKPYRPLGSRAWQDDYCEWTVRRDARSGKLLSAMFTVENPDYWRTLWAVDPALVTGLYRSILQNERVREEDLYLREEGGIVVDPTTGRPAYDVTNKWNRGTVTDLEHGGAVHLTTSPNNLHAEIGIVAAATTLREHGQNPHELTCAGKFGVPLRNSDPHLGFVVQQLVRNLHRDVTLADPVGIYIQDPDFSTYSLPPKAAPHLKPRDFWRVIRGSAGGRTLNAVFEVPREYGFTVSDISINGQPIRWASQIAETFELALAIDSVPAHARTSTLLPDVEYRADSEPQPLLVAPAGLLRKALREHEALPWSIPELRRGRVVKGLAVLAWAARDGNTLTVDGGGVDIRKTGPVTEPDAEGFQLFEVEIAVSTNASAGRRDVAMHNPSQAPGRPARALIRIVE